MSYQAKPIELLKPLNNIPKIVEATELFNTQWLQYYHSSKDLTLYHYTTSKGLIEILDSRSIWCSHIKYFNDPMEWVYGESKVIYKIEALLKNEKDNNIKKLLEDLKMWIKSITNLFDIYAACFCKNGNLLSQWRSYSNQGRGYSLGFTFNSDTKITYDYINKPNIKLAGFRKIIYDPETQNSLIDYAIDKLIEAGSFAINQELKKKR